MERKVLKLYVCLCDGEAVWHENMAYFRRLFCAS